MKYQNREFSPAQVFVACTAYAVAPIILSILVAPIVGLNPKRTYLDKPRIMGATKGGPWTQLVSLTPPKLSGWDC